MEPWFPDWVFCFRSFSHSFSIRASSRRLPLNFSFPSFFDRTVWLCSSYYSFLQHDCNLRHFFLSPPSSLSLPPFLSRMRRDDDEYRHCRATITTSMWAFVFAPSDSSLFFSFTASRMTSDEGVTITRWHKDWVNCSPLFSSLSFNSFPSPSKFLHMDFLTKECRKRRY